MMNIYKFSDGEAYFDGMTPDGLQWMRAGAQAVGADVGAIVMADDPDAPDAPAVALLWVPPGGVVSRHFHDCYRVEVVVRGSIRIGDEVLLPGDVWTTSTPGEAYGPHVAGEEGCLSAEIVSSTKGLVPQSADDASPEDHERHAKVLAAIQATKGS
jgi:hypothetical protein